MYLSFINHILSNSRKHLFKHHGKEAHAKFVEERHKKYKKKTPGICQVCGEHVDDQRVHLIAWHPDISAPGLWKNDLTKGIRKLSKKPRWADRLNKRQEVLSEQGKLSPNSNQMENSERSGDMKNKRRILLETCGEG